MNNRYKRKIISAFLALILCVSGLAASAPYAYADDFDEQLSNLQKEKESKQNERNAAQNKLQELKAKQDEILEYKLALEERNDAAQKEIDLIEQEIELYSQMIEDKGKEVVDAQEKEETQLEKFRVRIRAMEENGSYNILTVILNADSFSGLLAAIDDYGDVMNSDKKLYEDLQEARENLEEVKEEYEDYKDECETHMGALVEEQAELKAEIEDSEAQLDELAEQIKEAEEEQRKAEEALAAASGSITAFLENYYQNKNSGGNAGGGDNTSGDTGNSGGIQYDTSLQNTDSAYAWPFPASNRVSSGFKARWGRQHSGVDIDGYGLAGSNIVASRSGTVILAGWSGGYGNCVMIDHGDTVTLYGHMSGIAVSVGQAVSQGQVVGYCGMTGSATGYHLHFEIRVGGSAVNPLPYLPGGWVGEDGWDVES